MLTTTRFTTVISVLALFLVSASQTAIAQETDERRSLYDDAGQYVYVSYFQIPWARVDSLVQLAKIGALPHRNPPRCSIRISP